MSRNLRPLLNACGNDPRFRLILYTLDESTYARELAPLPGHHPAARLGARAPVPALCVRDGRVHLGAGAGAPRGPLSRGPAGCRVVVPRQPGGDEAVPAAGHGDRRPLQHGGVRRRYPRVLLHSRPARPLAPGGRQLARRAGGAPRGGHGGCPQHGAGPRVRPREGCLPPGGRRGGRCAVLMTFRWFGPDDPVPLEHIRQIPGVEGIVTALHHVPPGEVWRKDDLERLGERIASAGLRFAVAESVPVHEDIKLGRPTRDRLIENYCRSVRHLGELGIPVLCYNFMPVFDWMRTNLSLRLDDG